MMDKTERIIESVEKSIKEKIDELIEEDKSFFTCTGGGARQHIEERAINIEIHLHFDKIGETPMK